MLIECVREGLEDVLYIYVINDEVNFYNLIMLEKNCMDFVEIDVKDFIKDLFIGRLNLKIKLVSFKIEGLFSILLFVVNVRVMFIRNCKVDDGFVNGVMGYVFNFVYGYGYELKIVVVIGVLFDNMFVGKKFGKRIFNGNIVLIERV